jgi:hypothetical protein
VSDIQLVTLDGIARKSGEDTEGLQWTEYSLEEAYFCEDGEGCNTDGMAGSCVGHGDYCEECNTEIYSGWLCLDGGEVVCSKHVHYPK